MNPLAPSTKRKQHGQHNNYGGTINQTIDPAHFFRYSLSTAEHIRRSCAKSRVKQIHAKVAAHKAKFEIEYKVAANYESAILNRSLKVYKR